MHLPIVPYVTERVPNPMPGGLPWQRYHAVRNVIVAVCRKHGSAGPMGVCPIEQDRDEPDLDQWEMGADDPVYSVVDDQYNDERYIYVAVKPEGMTEAWLADIASALRKFPEWGVCISNVQHAYIIIRGDSILVTGDILRGCDTVAELAELARAARTALVI